MKKKVIIALVLAMTLTFSFAGCSKSSNSGSTSGDAASSDTTASESADSSVATVSAGKIVVAVPDGYELTVGDITGANEDSDDYYYISKGGEPTFEDYISLNISMDAENAQSSLDMTKDWNEGGTDKTSQAGGAAWVGYEYDSSGTPCFAAYAEKDGVIYYIGGTGHAFDSEEVQNILETVSAAQ